MSRGCGGYTRTAPVRSKPASLLKMLVYDGWVISERELTDQLMAAVECDPLIRPDILPACRMIVCRLVPAILRTLREELRNARPIATE
jgi:hypothetical protein